MVTQFYFSLWHHFDNQELNIVKSSCNDGLISSLILWAPSKTSPKLPSLPRRPTAGLQERTFQSWLGRKALSRHTKKLKIHLLLQIYRKTLPVPYWTILSPRPSLVSSKSMTSHLEHSYFSFRWRSQDKNPTSLTGLVPLAASRQLSSLIILRKKSDIQ